jgi:hypothetical protein
MSMAKQIYYHNLRKAKKREVGLSKSEEKECIKNKINISYTLFFSILVMIKIIIFQYS